MADFAAQLCPREGWHLAGYRYHLSDPGEDRPAMSFISSQEQDGQATVFSMEHDSRFQPIDHCTVYDCLFGRDRRCDGVVCTHDMRRLAFVELKDRRGKYFQEAAEQLQSTIATFRRIDPTMMGRVVGRKAYIANRKAHHQSKVSPAMASRILEFDKLTGYRLIVSTEIIV